MTRAIDELKNDHLVIARALEDLASQTEAMRRGRKADVQSLRDALEFSRTFIDRCHHGKEEGCLFPCLAERGIGRESPILQVMLQEHQLGREIVGRLGAMLDLYEGGVDKVDEMIHLCEEYHDLLETHIQKENGMLFPMGDESMEGSDDEVTTSCFDKKKDEIGRAEIDRLAEKVGRGDA